MIAVGDIDKPHVRQMLATRNPLQTAVDPPQSPKAGDWRPDATLAPGQRILTDWPSMQSMLSNIRSLREVKPKSNDEKLFFKAVIQRDLVTIYKLITENEDLINCVDCRGNTALHYAAKYDDISLAEYLLNHGAKADLKNTYGKTPAEIAKKLSCDDIWRLISKSLASSQR